MAVDRVLIVGGGIAGLSLACALRRRDIACAVVDQRDGSQDAGLGLNLPGNATRALRQLGLGDEIVGRGAPVRRREYRTAKGRLLFAVDEGAFWGDAVSSVCVRRGELVGLLRTGVTPETVRWNSAVADIVPGTDHVEVRFADGRTESYRLVVGADGVRSTVRRAMLGTADPRPALLTAASWRFVVPGAPVDCWTAWLGSGVTFLLIPVGADHVYGFASATGGGAVSADPEWLTSTFATFADPVPGVVAAALAEPPGGDASRRWPRLYHSPMEEVRVDRWSKQRIVLVGDAAHASAPIWAQGAALAIEDALVLADLLGTRDDWAEVGAEYERRRRPRVGHVQAATDRAARIAGLPPWLRDLVGPVVGPRAYRHAYGPLRQPVL